MSERFTDGEPESSTFAWIASICEQLGDGYLVFAQWQCVGLGGRLWREAGSPRLYQAPEEDWLGVFHEDDRGVVALALADPAVNRFPAARVLDRRTKEYVGVALRLFKPPFDTQPGLFVLVAAVHDEPEPKAGSSADEAIFEASPTEMLVLDAEEGRILGVNRSFLERNGLKRSALLDRRLDELEVIDPQAAELLLGVVQIGGQLRRRPVLLQGRNGAREMLANSAALGAHRILLTFCDVTLLNAATRHLHEILDSLPAGVFTKDRSGTYLLSNAAADRMLNGGDPLRNGTDEQLFPEEIARTMAEGDRQVFERGEAVESEVRLETSGGEARCYRFFRTALKSEQGVPQRLLTMVHDVTDEVHAGEALVRARELAVRANCAKDDFLVNTGHEVRTPMNAIMGFSALLAETDLSAEQREMLEMLRAGGTALGGIIEAILELSQLASGQFSLDEQEFDLGVLVEETLAGFGQEAAGQGLQLYVEVDPQLPARCVGDPGRLGKLIHCLMSNALKFTPEGAVSCALDLEAVDDAGWAEVRLRVRDSGIGIAPEFQESVFQPFFQVDSSSSRAFEGTGLGLAIARRLAEAMGGELSLETAAGEGAAFSARLRLRAVPGGSISEQVPWPAQGELVVLAEDEAAAKRLVKPLQGSGLNVRLVENFSQFASTVCRPGFRGAGLLDLGLAGELECRRLMDWVQGPKRVPLVVVAPADLPGLDSGSVRVLSSFPLRPSELRNAVLTILPDQERVEEPVKERSEALSRARPARPKGGRALIIDDRGPEQERLVRCLRAEGCEVDFVDGEHAALESARVRDYGVIFFEEHFVGDETGPFIQQVRERLPHRSSPLMVAIRLDGTGGAGAPKPAIADAVLPRSFRQEELLRILELAET